MTALPRLSSKILRSVAAILSTIWTFTLGAQTILQKPVSSNSDPAFEPGLTALLKTSRIAEDYPDRNRAQWRPNLRLLIGVKAVEGAKSTIFFVELTTMSLQRTNASLGQSTGAILHTNRISCPGPMGQSTTNMLFEFTYRLAPLRVRVFDQSARILREGQTAVPWELMTNSLAEVCRFCAALRAIQAMPLENQQNRNQALEELLGGMAPGSVDWSRLMRPIAGGVLTLGGLLSECVSSPALSDICEKAQCSIRSPGAWALMTTALGGTFDLALDPRFLTDVSIVKTGVEGRPGPWYRFPADLKNGKRKLVSVEFVVGPSSGAEVILAGIRSIRAVHPTKPNQEFIAQVLAAGTAPQDSTEPADSAE